MPYNSSLVTVYAAGRSTAVDVQPTVKLVYVALNMQIYTVIFITYVLYMYVVFLHKFLPSSQCVNMNVSFFEPFWRSSSSLRAVSERMQCMLHNEVNVMIHKCTFVLQGYELYFYACVSFFWQ